MWGWPQQPRREQREERELAARTRWNRNAYSCWKREQREQRGGSRERRGSWRRAPNGIVMHTLAGRHPALQDAALVRGHLLEDALHHGLALLFDALVVAHEQRQPLPVRVRSSHHPLRLTRHVHLSATGPINLDSPRLLKPTPPLQSLSLSDPSTSSEAPSPTLAAHSRPSAYLVTSSSPSTKTGFPPSNSHWCTMEANAPAHR